MKRQTGFTLIELITVIVILGVLAVVALPQYIDLQDEADQAATDGVAGALGAAAAVNLAGELAGDTAASVSVHDCADVEDALTDDLSTDYSIATTTGFVGTTTGETADCALTGRNSTTATFTAYYVS